MNCLSQIVFFLLISPLGACFAACLKEGNSTLLKSIVVEACLAPDEADGKGGANARFVLQTVKNISNTDLEIELSDPEYRDFAITIFNKNAEIVSRRPIPPVADSKETYPSSTMKYLKLPRGAKVVLKYDLLERMSMPPIPGSLYVVFLSGQVNFLRPGEDRGKAVLYRQDEMIARRMSVTDIQFDGVRLK